MNRAALDTFFHHISRLVVIIPLVVIALALIFKPSEKNSPRQEDFISPTPLLNQKNTILSDILKGGSYACRFNTPDGKSKTTALIRDKDIFVENVKKKETDYLLVKKDCVYTWEKGRYSGEKICGLAPYFSTIESLSDLNVVNIDSLISSVLEFGGGGASKEAEATAKNLISTCRKKEIKDTSLFEIPKGVLFKNRQLK
ncbi:hypothetical protein HYT33_03130 [Candidatus Roizmanbacteria bacterium]|nr:hypothetical protein [Candidatus Roizmanbacteria bacterium]